jgi:hypothetical protein
MPSITTFKLDISYGLHQDCVFVLASIKVNDIESHPSIDVDMPAGLIMAYESWQTSVKNFNPANSTQSSAKSEEKPKSLEIKLTPKIDFKQNLDQAEIELLKHFKKWVMQEKLIPIWRIIEKEAKAKATENQKNRRPQHWVDLVIVCQPLQRDQQFPKNLDLAKLPWEELPLAPAKLELPIRIFQDVASDLESAEKRHQQKSAIRHRRQEVLKRRSPRILAIVATHQLVDFRRHKEALESLEKIGSEITPFQYDAENKEHQRDFKQQLLNRLKDDRGWDIIFFAGHGEEKDENGWRLEFAPGIWLEREDLEAGLTEAANQGLRLAILNCCYGCRIANILIEKGVDQVIAMREEITDRASGDFMAKLCGQLNNYQDIWQAFQVARRYLEQEKTSHSSAYLMPTLYRDSHAELFRFEPSPLRKLWWQWKPISCKEVITVASLLLIGAPYPVREFLFDLRQVAQAMYRQTVFHQIPAQPDPPPIRLVSIDQASINQAKSSLKEFKIKPIDRRYLAQLVNQLTTLKANVVGIDYYLYTEEPRQQEDLNPAIQKAIQQGTWLTFATIDGNQVIKSTADPRQTLQGRTDFLPWSVEVDLDCKTHNKCPFAYLLAASRQLQNQSVALPEVVKQTAISGLDLQTQLNKIYPQHPEAKPQLKWPGVPWKWLEFLLGVEYVMDFSIPPNRVYEWTAAKDLLTLDPAIQEKIQEQIVIIAAGGDYREAEDTFPVRLALHHWCDPPQKTAYCAFDLGNSGQENPFNSRQFTGGEVHAYMAYHWLYPERQVVQVHNFWAMAVAIVVGKAIFLVLINRETLMQKRLVALLNLAAQRFLKALRLYSKSGESIAPFSNAKLVFWLLSLGSVVYGGICLQIYIWWGLLIPWFLPSAITWVYLLSVVPLNQVGSYVWVELRSEMLSFWRKKDNG